MNQFKKAQLLLLPTDTAKSEYHQIVKLCNKDLHRATNVKSITSRENCEFYELYIINNDKIQDGDWVTNGKLIFQRKSTIGLSENCKKVIATTNTLLKLISLSHLGENWLDVSLPQLSKKWIEYYISEYNKGNVITDVEVGYELNTKELFDDSEIIRCVWDEDYRLKINSDNTITIKSTKDSWNREEVKQKMKDSIAYSLLNSDVSLGTIDKWINENL